jgi:hypothetical protein
MSEPWDLLERVLGICFRAQEKAAARVAAFFYSDCARRCTLELLATRAGLQVHVQSQHAHSAATGVRGTARTHRATGAGQEADRLSAA